MILKSNGLKTESCATPIELCFDELHEEPILTLLSSASQETIN